LEPVSRPDVNRVVVIRSYYLPRPISPGINQA
jgi:hypothetical protein